jgi:hypothetical protein
VLSLHLKRNDEIKEKIMADNVINSSHLNFVWQRRNRKNREKRKKTRIV